MRFVERAVEAMDYHHRAYLLVFIGSLIFAAISMTLLTGEMLAHNNKMMFHSRLNTFDNSAVSSAQHLIYVVQSTYWHVTTTLDHYWWALIVLVAIISAIYGLVFSHSRRNETQAYLLVGKGVFDITGQYILESVIVYTVAFLLIFLLLTLLIDPLSNGLNSLNRWLFNQDLAANVSKSTFNRITKKLFDHKVTSFTGQDLFFPPRGPKPNYQLAGAARTYLAGLGSYIIGQGLAFLASIWHTKRHLNAQ